MLSAVVFFGIYILGFLSAIRVYTSVSRTNLHEKQVLPFLFEVCLCVQKLLAVNSCANFYETRILRFQ